MIKGSISCSVCNTNLEDTNQFMCYEGIVYCPIHIRQLDPPADEIMEFCRFHSDGQFHLTHYIRRSK